MPGADVMAIYLLALVAVVAAVPSLLLSHLAGQAVTLLALGVLCFYLWPIYTTYYTVSTQGIRVRYGPWTREYPWSDFVAAYWQKGMFATRIGWPSMTPCVRLFDGVLLQRRTGRFGLYLTPNDSRAFLRKVAEFAPNQTAETII